MNQWREEYYETKEENDYLENLDDRLSEKIEELETDRWRLKTLLLKVMQKVGGSNE